MSEKLEYEGRTVVVTGGTGELGTAVVDLLLDRVRGSAFPASMPESTGAADSATAERRSWCTRLI